MRKNEIGKDRPLGDLLQAQLDSPTWNGAAFREFRRANEVSQGELAERTGLTQALVSLIEGGKQNFTEDSGTRLWNALYVLSQEKYATSGRLAADAKLRGVKGGPEAARLWRDADRGRLEKQFDGYEPGVPVPEDWSKCAPLEPPPGDARESFRRMWSLCEFQRDLLSRLTKAESLEDAVFGEVREILKRDIQALESELFAELAKAKAAIGKPK